MRKSRHESEIDNLSVAALDRAIASAMEPEYPANPWSHSSQWWHFGFAESWDKNCSARKRIPAKKLSGNVAVELLEKLKEWNWFCILDQGDLAWRMTANYFGDDQERTCEASGDFTIAVARLFLRVHEARKAMAP